MSTSFSSVSTHLLVPLVPLVKPKVKTLRAPRVPPPFASQMGFGPLVKPKAPDEYPQPPSQDSFSDQATKITMATATGAAKVGLLRAWRAQNVVFHCANEMPQGFSKIHRIHSPWVARKLFLFTLLLPSLLPWFKKVQTQMSNEKNTGCLGYVRDEILPSYIGIIS